MNYKVGHKHCEDCTQYRMQNYGRQLVVTFADNTEKTFNCKHGWLMSSTGKQIMFTRKKK